MRTSQRETRLRVIKCRRLPRGCRVARRAIGGKSRVRRVNGCVIVFLVTSDAGCRRARIRHRGVTSRARCADVRSRQRETRFRMVECRRLPAHGRVATLTILRESLCRMRRICCRHELGIVTVIALRRYLRKSPAWMALRARGRHVGTRQWEARRVVVKPSSPGYGNGGMTLDAVRPQSRGPVWRIRRRFKLRTMTAVAVYRHIHVFKFLLVDVTSLAGNSHVGTKQGESCLSVPLAHIWHKP